MTYIVILMSFQAFFSINCVELTFKLKLIVVLSCLISVRNEGVTWHSQEGYGKYNQTSRVTLLFLIDDKKELKSSINLQVRLI